MPLELGIWRVEGGSLHRLTASTAPSERWLEDALESDPSLLALELLVVGRQVTTSYGKRIDLLAIDGDGVVYEPASGCVPRWSRDGLRISFLGRAVAFDAAHGIRVERLLTDDAKMYRCSYVFRATGRNSLKQRFSRPRRLQTNGKVERHNRTLLEEWAYVRLCRSNGDRRRLLSAWLHRYNHHRSHTPLKGKAPISRINNLAENYNEPGGSREPR
jgi:Integrase core domain